MKKNKDKNKGFKLTDIILIIIITSLITSLTTGVIVYNQNRLTKNITFQDLSNDESLKDFLKVYASLIDEYYEDVDTKKMLESAIEAMFNYLGEDYSTYMSKEETDSLSEKLKGEYKGIGIQISKTDNSIVGFIDGGSAEESGLNIGDVVVSVNNKKVESSDEIVSTIQDSKEGDKIDIAVIRNGENMNFQVEYKTLYVPAIQYSMIENNIGYLRMETFSQTLAEQVEIALKKLESNDMKSLIIDLRNNTGGFLSEAYDIANMFLEKGKLVYSLEEKEGTKEYKADSSEKKDYKVVLLFNENSASASEVLIAALKESYGAITVGTKSYGKGKVQQTHTLDDGSMVKYTSAKWLTPNGTCIDSVGITPEYVIELNTETEIDEQLEKALELAK